MDDGERAKRLEWIYGSQGPEELRQRYDQWASDYDADMDSMDWSAPRTAAQRVVAHLSSIDGSVFDAGCGTGQVGYELARCGVRHITGFDLSEGMLEQSRRRDVYESLVQGSLLERLPFADDDFDAAVSVGVFTYGHVGAEALRELVRIIRPGGHVTLALRDDVAAELGVTAMTECLEAERAWVLVERTEPDGMVTEEGTPVPMRAWTWRVSPQ